MMSPEVTRVVEDYTTLIWKAYEWPGRIPTTTDLAAQLDVTPSTVSATLKKLAFDGFINYEPYGQIELTDAGRSVAIDIVRRHRILETYLNQKLDVPWDQVHAEADRLEHAISNDILDRMDRALGYPTTDPHGDPIPDANGDKPPDSSVSLIESEPGTRVRVTRISDRSSDILRYLDGHKITIGSVMDVTDINPAAEIIGITVGDASTQLSFKTADAIRVAPNL